jgi:type I restriction enzyme S subunit
MNADLLLEHYEQIADAPDAIVRLRRFILDLAVRGKLVPQDPNDEPASELLKRIAAEKVRLVKAGEIRTPKAIPPLPETPFPIPSNWRWSQLADIGVLSPRNEAPDTLEASFVPMPMIAAKYGVANKHEIRQWGEIKKGYTHFAEGDVGLAKITPCFENGKSAVFRNLTGGIGAGTTELHIVRPLFVDQDFILLFLKSPHFIETGIPKMTGTAGQKRVPTEYFAHSPFPLPPLAEQHRIVAKVDELMALCDQLNAARAEREASRDRLAAASLARLNTPAPETFKEDARFALDALPALTARADQIKALRLSILNLAVRGKLVSQDQNDDPASELLKRIASEKARLVKLGEIRKSKPLPAIGSIDLPFLLPDGWAWTRLGDVIHLISGQHLQPTEYCEEKKAGLPYITGPSDFGSTGLSISRFALVRKAVAKKGQLLLTVKGSGVGKTTICDIPEVAISRQLMALTAIDWDDRFLLLVTYRLAEKLQAEARSLIPGISREDVDEFVVPLPPLAEQHRIVAKVDELMALCDQLEACLTNATSTRSRLLNALLAEALTPVETRDLEAVE